MAPEPAFDWAIALREQRRAMGAPTVAGVINTLNEEVNLPDALRSLGWVDELIVVDMHSDDATRDIAESFGARVELFDRCGFVEPARNFALAQAAGHDWIMLLDADERVPRELAEQLVSLSFEADVACVQLPYANHLLGARLYATVWGGEYHPRFFRSGAVNWPTQIHGGATGAPEADGRTLFLPRRPGAEVEHHNIRDLAHFTEKTNRYTDNEPEVLADSATGWEAAATAARAEFTQRWSPAQDGTRSVALSTAMIFYRLLSHLKAWEARGYGDVDVPADGNGALRALQPSEPPVDMLSDLAVVLHARGDATAAEALLRACLALDPTHAGALDNLNALTA
jgi:hypothetical protein